MNPEVARAWWAGFNDQGIPSLDVCDDAVEIGNVAEFPVQGPYRGHEGVRRWVTDLFEVWDEARVELEEVVDAHDGETVVTVQRILARAKHTRIPVDARWAAVWTIRDGKVARIQGYASRSQAREAAGLPRR